MQEPFSRSVFQLLEHQPAVSQTQQTLGGDGIPRQHCDRGSNASAAPRPSILLSTSKTERKCYGFLWSQVLMSLCPRGREGQRFKAENSRHLHFSCPSQRASRWPAHSLSPLSPELLVGSMAYGPVSTFNETQIISSLSVAERSSPFYPEGAWIWLLSPPRATSRCTFQEWNRVRFEICARFRFTGQWCLWHDKMFCISHKETGWNRTRAALRHTATAWPISMRALINSSLAFTAFVGSLVSIYFQWREKARSSFEMLGVAH